MKLIMLFILITILKTFIGNDNTNNDENISVQGYSFAEVTEQSSKEQLLRKNKNKKLRKNNNKHKPNVSKGSSTTVMLMKPDSHDEVKITKIPKEKNQFP